MVKFDPATRALLKARLIMHISQLPDADLGRLLIAEVPRMDLFREELLAIEKYAESLVVEIKA